MHKLRWLEIEHFPSFWEGLSLRADIGILELQTAVISLQFCRDLH